MRTGDPLITTDSAPETRHPAPDYAGLKALLALGLILLIAGYALGLY